MTFEIDKDFRELNKLSTRPVTCPDGIIVTVTMGKWFWHHLEALCAIKYFEYDELVSNVFDIASVDYGGTETFGHRFIACLQGYLLHTVQYIDPLHCIGYPDNDNQKAILPPFRYFVKKQGMPSADTALNLHVYARWGVRGTTVQLKKLDLTRYY